MSPRQTKTPPEPLVLKLDPTIPLQVRIIEPARKPGPPNLWLRLFAGVAFFFGLASLWLWSTFVFPRTFPPPIEISPLSITLIQPSYVAVGDDAHLDVTVTNRDSVPITGTLTVVFTGAVSARPVVSDTTTVRFDALASGASLTQRVRFLIAQSPIFFSRDSVQVGVQTTIGNQNTRRDNQVQIPIAPLPYINTFVTFLSGSGIVVAVASYLWDEFRKRVLGMETRGYFDG